MKPAPAKVAKAAVPAKVGRYSTPINWAAMKPGKTDKAIAKMPRYVAPKGVKLRKAFPDLPGQMP